MEILQNFVAFSEYMNFKRIRDLTDLINIDCAVAPGVSMKTERGRGSEFGLILRLECLGSAVAAAA